MNDLVLSLGLAQFKPLVTALLLPPVPLLLLILLGGLLMLRRRLLAWLLLLTGIVGIWLCSTSGMSRQLMWHLLHTPPALTQADLAAFKREARGPTQTAIVVLGGGRRTLAPEYGTAMLHTRSVERLRYGLWLSRETGLPVAFSGGVGRGETSGPTEAELAARIAQNEFNRPLRWLENKSRDTSENATQSVALLRDQGITHIVLVTHAYHMPRAMRNFERAAAAGGQAAGPTIKLQAAPLGVPERLAWQWADWLPSHRGVEENRLVWHEWLGWVFGA
jgi:uncharacterized SAM-binding protein YcdF (DUF218 family)